MPSAIARGVARGGRSRARAYSGLMYRHERAMWGQAEPEAPPRTEGRYAGIVRLFSDMCTSLFPLVVVQSCIEEEGVRSSLSLPLPSMRNRASAFGERRWHALRARGRGVLFWPTARLIFSLRATAPHLGGWVGGEEHEAARSWMGRPLGAGTEPDEVGESPTGGRAFHGRRAARARTISH